MLQQQPYQVLLIEDDKDDERIAIRALQQSGIPMIVKIVRDGDRALDALLSTSPDLVISDLKLPMMNGNDVLRRAKAQGTLEGVPFVVFSSSDDPVDIEESLQAGASEYVTKPVDYKLYRESVRGIVQKWIGSAARKCLMAY